MKKTLLFFAATLCFIISFAQPVRHTIKVSNFQFSPSTTNAHLGDTILWVWKEGSHTTTSLAIPANAKPWDRVLNSTQKRFKYVVKKTGTYNFKCKPHAPAMAGKIIVTASLTAGLSDINVDSKNGQSVLTWKVNDNRDISYFSVQRSTDGENFTEIAKVKPSELNDYVYADEAVMPEKYVYYQVELTDKKGNTELSSIKMFTAAPSNSKLITSLSPNPISSPGHLMFQFNADAAGKMRVQLFDQNGKLVKEADMTAITGLNNGHFHLGDLTPGSYYLVCTLGNKSERKTIVYQ
jgi:plastocyanin